jgi:hypothetical protein
MLWQPGVSIEQVEREVIFMALNHFQGNRTKAAEALVMPLRTLGEKIAKYKAAGFVVPAPALGQTDSENTPLSAPVKPIQKQKHESQRA